MVWGSPLGLVIFFPSCCLWLFSRDYTLVISLSSVHHILIFLHLLMWNAYKKSWLIAGNKHFSLAAAVNDLCAFKVIKQVKLVNKFIRPRDKNNLYVFESLPPLPTTPKWNFTLTLNTVCQTGKLWIPFFKSFWHNPTENLI